MDEKQEIEWVAQCAHRLRQRWRTVDPRTLEEVAAELLRDDESRALRPAEAATRWLRRGLPGA